MNFNLFFLLFIHSTCIYRKEAHKFFDKFFFLDKLNLYQHQINTGSCEIIDGPSCFYIEGEETLNNNMLLSLLSKDLVDFSLSERVSILVDRIEKLTETYKKKHHKQFQQIFTIQPKVQMNLLLTFESYDEMTIKSDLYMSEEKIIKFNIGYLKLNFKGKLRLSFTKDEKGSPSKTVSNGNPSKGTYGIIESEFEILFDKPVIISYFYVKCDGKRVRLNENCHFRYSMKEYNLDFTFVLDDKWKKINVERKAVKSFIIDGPVLIDDISINYDSDNDDDVSKNNNTGISKIIEEVIDDLLQKNPIDD